MPAADVRLRCFTADLPAGRKGVLREYLFQETFRSESGACRETWSVSVVGPHAGDPYQLTLADASEQWEEGWKCDCPDATFRGSKDPLKKCKHLSELLRFLAETDGIWAVAEDNAHRVKPSCS